MSADLAGFIKPVALRLLGEPNNDLSSKDELRFGSHGSLSVVIAGDKRGTWYDHEARQGGGVLDLIRHKRHLANGEAVEWLHQEFPETLPEQAGGKLGRVVATYDYRAANGTLAFQVLRYEPKTFRQRRPDPTAKGGWSWSVKGVDLLPYRLPELLASSADAPVFIAEGEKDCDNLARLGLTATCNPAGAGKWRPAFGQWLRGRDVVILPDNDDAGRDHARQVAGMLAKVAGRIRVVALPNLPHKGDVSDWIGAGGTKEALLRLVEAAPDAKPEAPAKKEAPAIPDDAELTEDGIGLEFTKRHGADLRFCHTTGLWHQWTGTHWQPNRDKLAFSWARALVRELNREAEFKTKAITGKASFAAAVERFAQADRACAVTSEVWDKDTMLLGTPGGVVDLRTGVLRLARREDYITKTTSVAPVPHADCPQWLAFLKQATANDEALIRFLWQWCGYSLTGSTREHALLFVYGPGGNGKSVFLNVVSRILGDYATVAAMSTLTATTTDQHPTDLADLRGARLVTASETEEGRAWAESRIKSITGGDKIKARFMRQDFFEYLPQFKLTICGNHKPALRNVDEAARRRFNIVPFLHKPTKPDPQLEEKLWAEAPGILRWMIDGCKDWQVNGIKRPKVVTEATDEYFSEQDSVRQWIEECCEVDPRYSDTTEALFKSWTAYALASGEKPGTTKWFSQTLIRQNLKSLREVPGHRKKRGFEGLRVKLDEVQAPFSDRGSDDYVPF